MNSFKNRVRPVRDNSVIQLDKILSKTLLIMSLTAMSSTAYSGVKSLSSDEMGRVTGQAGLSIDLDAEEEQMRANSIDYQVVMPVTMATGNLALGAAASATGALLGFSSAAGYEDQLWSIDFVGASDEASEVLSNWGATGNGANAAQVYEIANIGTHGEVQQTVKEGDMVIHSDRSIHGFGSLGGHQFTVNRSLMGHSRHEGQGDINETIKWGDWDLIFDVENKNININVYIEAERDTIFDYLGMNVLVKVHNSRGEDQYIVGNADGSQTASFAHFQADIRPNEESGGVHFNILDFSGDVDYQNIAFGDTPSIGSVYITDFAIKADMHIYKH